MAIINIETGKYFHRNGDMKFYFQPEVREWSYIWLRMPNKDDKNLVVTQMSWNTRDFKLVIVNN